MKPASGSRLDSWKAIADYFGRNVRTVTRWADERGMPVHHVPGGKRGAVFAFTEEIDAWLVNHGNGAVEADGQVSREKQFGSTDGEALGLGVERGAVSSAQERQDAQASKAWLNRLLALKGWRFAFIAVAVLFVVVPMAFLLRPSSGQGALIFSVKYVGNALEAQGADGHTLWVHRYANPFADFPPTDPARIADFFRDGNKEIAAIINLRTGPNPGDELQREIDFFSGTGRLLWRYAPDKTFQFGAHELKGPWAFSDLLVSQSESQTMLWAATGHRTWGNSMVVQLDPYTGHDALRFVNTGSLHALNELKTSSGTFLLAGGFNNEWDGGSLAIINESRPFAASPQTPGTRHYCNSCAPGMPDYYFIFPRSEINRVSGIYENPVVNIRVTEDGIEVRKYERRSKGNESTIYLFGSQPPFELLSLRYDSDYDVLHLKWSVEGKLKHSLEKCPERMRPHPVRLWTPSVGWKELPVKPAKVNQ